MQMTRQWNLRNSRLKLIQYACNRIELNRCQSNVTAIDRMIWNVEHASFHIVNYRFEDYTHDNLDNSG